MKNRQTTFSRSCTDTNRKRFFTEGKTMRFQRRQDLDENDKNGIRNTRLFQNTQERKRAGKGHEVISFRFPHKYFLPYSVTNLIHLVRQPFMFYSFPRLEIFIFRLFIVAIWFFRVGLLARRPWDRQHGNTSSSLGDLTEPWIRLGIITNPVCKDLGR